MMYRDMRSHEAIMHGSEVTFPNTLELKCTVSRPHIIGLYKFTEFKISGSSGPCGKTLSRNLAMYKVVSQRKLDVCRYQTLYTPFIDLSRLTGEKKVTWHGLFPTMFMLETNPCVLVFSISLTLEAVTAVEFETRYRFYDLVRTKKSMNGVYKTNIDCSFIRGMVENYQCWPTIHLGPTGLSE